MINLNTYLIDIIEDKFMISGNIESLKENRLVFSYLQKQLKATITSDSIIISFKNKREDLLRIKKIFSRFNLDLEDADSVDDEMFLIKEEEEKFKLFSEMARDIRNNDCEKSDFEDFTNVLTRELPERMLYPLQLLSSYHMAFSQNSCNFSVPGAGKTSIVYGAYSYMKSRPYDDRKRVNKILVIGPLSSFAPWENEYVECFGAAIKSQRISSGSGVDKKYFFNTDTQNELVLISYQGILNCYDDIINYLKHNRTLIVLDEAHKIKKIDNASISEAILKIAPYAKARIILTGTPLPNGYEDLYNIFKFIWPFKNVVGMHPYQLKELTKNPVKNTIESLIDRIEPYFIRIRKSDLDNIPIPIEVKPILVEMDDVQNEIYNLLEYKVVEEYLEQGEGVLTDLKKAKLIRLMQVATNLNLLKKPIEDRIYDSFENMLDEKIMKSIKDYSYIPKKFICVKNLCNEIISNDGKVIIWCTFIENIKQLSEYLSINNISNKVLFGEVPTSSSTEVIFDSRESIIKEFHEDESLKVLIANPHAVGESISLHKVCHNAIYMEKSFNATHFLQSRDRIHRYGLSKDDIIKYYYLLSKDTIDEVIHQRLFVKKERMEAIIENSDIPLFDNMSDEFGREDLRSLVKAYVRRNKK